ncbi:MAG: zinc ribbon domain-containing protein [Gemmatimonadaceae bacterium]
MTDPSTSEIACPACSALGSGRFCSSCGAPLGSSACVDCQAELSAGARFCHDCGRTVAADVRPSPVEAPARTAASSLPWIVAAIALVTLLAFLAGNTFSSRRGSSLDGSQNALPQAGLDDRGGPDAPVRAPDISQLSPQERADRLFNRVMTLGSEGKTDSVLFFAPMAIESYRMLSPLNLDQRYELGRIAEVAGALPLARAQADTILGENPTHLLGLILASRIASLETRSADQTRYDARLVAAADAERAKNLPEYTRHQQDITEALSSIRRPPGASR